MARALGNELGVEFIVVLAPPALPRRQLLGLAHELAALDAGASPPAAAGAREDLLAAIAIIGSHRARSHRELDLASLEPVSQRCAVGSALGVGRCSQQPPYQLSSSRPRWRGQAEIAVARGALAQGRPWLLTANRTLLARNCAVRLRRSRTAAEERLPRPLESGITCSSASRGDRWRPPARLSGIHRSSPAQTCRRPARDVPSRSAAGGLRQTRRAARWRASRAR
jgi:hypothetical protein